MSKMGFESLEELLFPAYSEKGLEKIKKHRARNQDDGGRAEMLKKREEANQRASG